MAGISLVIYYNCAFSIYMRLANVHGFVQKTVSKQVFWYRKLCTKVKNEKHSENWKALIKLFETNVVVFFYPPFGA